jgi:RecA-family ATPase
VNEDEEEVLVLTTDQLFAAMEAHEHEGATKCSPREYGKMRSISPQLVYYHIRQGHIDKEWCLCGRSVIDIEKADIYFKKGDHREDA